VGLYVDTSVLEGHAASIFRVDRIISR